MTKPKPKPPYRAGTITMAQREIIAEGWPDYIQGKLTVLDISMAAGVSYETTRCLLSEMSAARKVNLSAQAREVNRRRNRDQIAAEMRRPKGITAPPFSEDWWAQNQMSAEKHFKACVASGHWQFYQSTD